MKGFDVIVVGAGIVGAAVCHRLKGISPNLKVLVIEKEASPGQHQTSRNSGVIHSGIYYRPSSLKSRLCERGNGLLVEFCENNHIEYEINGKLIVSQNQQEAMQLKKLAENAGASNIPIDIIDSNELKSNYKEIQGNGAIRVKSTGTVDYGLVCAKLLDVASERGLEIRFSEKVREIRESSSEVHVSTDKSEYSTQYLIVCAGLQSDQLSGAKGSDEVSICPVKGRYYNLKHESVLGSVKEHIYPVPDPKFPFLGIHFTKTLNDTFHVGPNAVLALSHESYTFAETNPVDMLKHLSRKEVLKFVRKNLKESFNEVLTYLSKKRFLERAQLLVPGVTIDDLEPAPSGIRAQAIDSFGSLVDDFYFKQTKRRLHVLNAPSPAATSSLAIADEIVRRSSL